MVLTVRYDDTGEIETFLLGVRGVEDADIDVYSMQSPLGRAIAGARPGEQRTYSIPSGANLPVTLLKAVPHGMHATQAHSHDLACPRSYLEGNEHDHYATRLDLNAGPRAAKPGTGHPALSVLRRNR